MLIATLSGNITRDAELRQAGQDKVASFGVASNEKVKGEEKVTFVDCSVFGRRGESLCQHLTKGKKVTVVGRMSTREHNGKTYLQINVSELDFGGGGKKEGGASESKSSGGGGYDDSSYDAGQSSAAADDGIPF